MKRKLSFIFSLLIMSLCFSLSMFAQETTGSIEVTVKDAQGAVVPNVTMTITNALGTGTSSTAGFKRSATTDGNGFVRIIQVPPGTYNVTAAATAGFQEKTIPNVQVSLGKATSVTVDMSTTVGATVNVSGDDVSPIDTTDTKIQTNISAQMAEMLPKGPNFASVLKISPATRPEPRSGQFQIDGASGSENTFIIDGQEVTNVRTGVLDANSNLPLASIQEVQIKSSGFEAEYGGATGGVVNVVTKGGSNQWQGEMGSQFRPSSLNALGRPTLRLRPSTGLPEYVYAQRDHYLEFNPSLNLSGPIFKDRLWFSGSYSPQVFTRTRTLHYLDDGTRLPTGRVETYKFKQVAERARFRLDGQPWSKLRVTAAYVWNPIWERGDVPTFASALGTPPILPGSNPPIDGAAYVNQTGGRQNSQSITGQATWTATSNLFISGRLGHYFLNEKIGTYGNGNPDIARLTCSGSSPIPFPAGFGCVRGFNNGVDLVSNTKYDATTRNTLDLDATYLFSGGGRHELKGGYQYNGIGNKVDSNTTDQIVLRFGQTIASYSGTSIPSAPGALGSGQLIIFGTQGSVNSKNEGIFIQDKYQPTSRLTFNLGIRTEREDVPSFAPNLPGIKFDFQDKMAPRLGVAYDLTGDGKTKVSAFYGLFYDRFKYELPRGSFGGDIYHQFFFEIFAGDTLGSFTRNSILGGGLNFIPGGACPATTTPVFGKVRCDRDNRVPSNAGLPLTEAGGIDPDIKAFQQREFTLTFERDLGRNMVFSGRFTHKAVRHTVEDAGFPNAAGSEYYIIGNPGEGLYAQQAEAFGLQAIKPERKFDALEFRLDRRFSNNFYFNLNYTWSRLVGNYSGLASSDEDGRLSPNVNRFFDQPQVGWTVGGGQDNGLLATDRPHVVKFNGAYNFDWTKWFAGAKGNTTDFEVFTTVQSGTPLTTIITVNSIDIVATKRGDMGRTEMFTETDFAIRHKIRFGNDNRFTLVGELDILNAFNEANETNRIGLIEPNGFSVDDPTFGLITQAQRNACDAPSPGFPFGNNQPCLIAGYKAFQNSGSASILTAATNPANRYSLYNQPSAYQGPRSVRIGVRFLF
jgi:hypothetical protein